MRKWKGVTTLLLAMCLLFTAMPITASAKDVKLTFKAKTSGKGNAIQVRSVQYDSADSRYDTAELEVKFAAPVRWKESSRVVSIKDDKGKSYDGWLKDREKKECDIVIEDLKEGRTYTIKISGIRKKGTSGYRTLTLSNVKIPAVQTNQKVKVLRVEVDDDNDDYDAYEAEIDIKFASKVQWKKNAKVSSVKDSKGKSYKGYLIDKEDDECEVYIKNMKYGETYTIKISGIRAKGASAYENITVKAKVPKRSNALRVKKVEYEEEDFYYDDDEDVSYYDYEPPYKVEFSFNRDFVTKGSSYILILDSAGKKYSTKNSYVEWDDDECEVYLSKRLKYGKTYRYEIHNIKAAGAGKYTTLKGSFVAR